MNSNSTGGSNTGYQKRAAGAFFGRRKTKPLKRSQAILLEELLPKLLIDLSQPPPDDLAKLFAADTGKRGKAVLEIGFGGGEHLIARAIEEPDTAFIGCEPFINGLGKALSAINENKIRNILIYNEDATDLLDWMPAASLDIIYLLYPDPWPKKRHWKRRFLNPDNLIRFSRILKPHGELRVASDIEHYINWTLNHCYNSQLFDWQASESRDWQLAWDGWQSTRYEKKALRECRTPCYLTFVRK